MNPIYHSESYLSYFLNYQSPMERVYYKFTLNNRCVFEKLRHEQYFCIYKNHTLQIL